MKIHANQWTLLNFNEHKWKLLKSITIDQNKKGQINIELDESVAEGTYSNLAIINHSVSEFIVDFIAMMPGIPKAKVKSRIILTPQKSDHIVC